MTDEASPHPPASGEEAPLWRPSPERVERATLTRFMRERGFADYESLWRWSVEDVRGFWGALWDFFGVKASTPYEQVLTEDAMPGERWFPGARLNFAECVFQGKDPSGLALVHESETREPGQVTWAELREQAAAIQAGLVRLGVGPGDRVCAYLPNLPETIAAFLAVAGLGAVWSSAAPEFGARSVIDRFAQIEPKVLLAVDGYRYNGREFGRAGEAAQIAEAIGARLVSFGYLDGSGWEPGFLRPGELQFEQVGFEDPLWVLYSSGTTGLPKAIVHGHGGILLELLKLAHLHFDAQAGDRVFWFTTTGWAMWNILLGVLLTEATMVLYDGSPGYPTLDRLWDLTESAEITTFGTSAGFIAQCMKAGVEPRSGRDLKTLRAIGSTGSPLAPEGFDWVYERVGEDIWLFSTSGGTEVCTAFVGGVPTLPVYRGELQARALGCKIESWDPDGRPLIGQLGELVLTEPIPSMPTHFWGDPGKRRLRETYFEQYPGVWRHGDWIEITERGTAIISGRSDSTINRGGIRIGTSEIYRAVLAAEAVVDALVVDFSRDGRDLMPLFVVLRDGMTLDDELTREIATRVRETCSPRHVPDLVRQIAEVPKTLSGKALEIPVKRILMGEDPERVASRESMANPAALAPFIAWASDLEGKSDI